MGSRGDEYVVEAILDSRKSARGSGNFEYLIKWANYDSSYNTWEPEKNLIPGAVDMLNEYDKYKPRNKQKDLNEPDLYVTNARQRMKKSPTKRRRSQSPGRQHRRNISPVRTKPLETSYTDGNVDGNSEDELRRERLSTRSEQWSRSPPTSPQPPKAVPVPIPAPPPSCLDDSSPEWIKVSNSDILLFFVLLLLVGSYFTLFWR